jgi:hypothetical protein
MEKKSDFVYSGFVKTCDELVIGYKKEKLECVVREHRLKFGNHPVPTRNERSTDLFSTSGNSNFMPQRMATAET